ncbi:MAG: hypothetical protein D6791_17995 [Chloroflexi bacterium]|nr:MAG: hypothetical protein D6791_17995 [Chloroflexota bacterium]
MRSQWISLLLVTIFGLAALPILIHSMPATAVSRGASSPPAAFAPPPHSLPVPRYQSRPLAQPGSSSASNTGIFENNLLVNPSFEGDFYQPPESLSSLVAQGWSIWFVDPRPTDHIPEWNEEVLLGQSKLSWRVRHGDKAQKMFSSFSTHQGGLYQQVNVVPGSDLEFSIWVEVWSSDCDKNCISPLEPGVVCPSQNTHGNYRVSVGIDPTGGTDPLASTVHWKAYRLPYDIPYDTWNRLVITDTAQASQVTVFTQGWAEFRVKHNDSYWEDAALTYITPPNLPNKDYLPLVLRDFEGAPVSTATPTVTLTPAATQTPPPTQTSTPVPTSTGTPTPTHTSVPPTITPTATPSCNDVITNGGFESDTGWEFQAGVPYPPDYSTDQAAEGARSLRLGIPAGDPNVEGWSAAWQSISLPASLQSATLSFSYYPVSDDLERDYFEVRLLDESGAPIAYLVHPLDGQSNAQTWLSRQFDLRPYAGRTIQLYFNVYNDGQNGTTRTYLDDVRVEVCGASTPATSLQSVHVRAPQFNILQSVPFGQVHFTWARYGKHTPNVNWTDCENPTDVEVEWVYVKNEGKAVNLEGWTLEDGDGNVFTFPHFILGAGEGLRIWTDARENGPNDVFMGRAEQIWNDDADRATLRFPNGDLATGSLCWFEAGGFPVSCPDEAP